MAGFIDILRTGAWLNPARMRMVAFALLAATLIGAGFLIATSDGLNDRFGRPARTDFPNVYAPAAMCSTAPPRRHSIPPGNTPASRRSSARPRHSTAGTNPPFFPRAWRRYWR